MRALREHPCLAAARVVGAICLVLIGVATSAVDGRGDGDRVRATEARLAAASASNTSRGAELRIAVARGRRAELSLARAQRRVEALTRTSPRLRREPTALDRTASDAGRRTDMFIRAFITMVAADAVDRHMREHQRRAWIAEDRARAEAGASRHRPPPAAPASYNPSRPERTA